MRLEEARGLLMQALRMPGWNQASNLFIAVGNLKGKLEGRDHAYVTDGRQFLDRGDKSVLLEVIWSLIIQGILIPGLDDGNQGWPFLRLTEYGRRCVEEDRILPHDPDGYLSQFKSAIPDADATITEYLTESLQCFVHGLNRAAAVMLGAASEKAVLLLIESYKDSIGDAATKQRFESEIGKAQSVRRKYGFFEKRFSAIKNSIPKELVANVESLLDGVFDLIRNSRNDAGHPASGILVDRDIVYSHLRLFIPYCQRIYRLIGWFESNES